MSFCSKPGDTEKIQPASFGVVAVLLALVSMLVGLSPSDGWAAPDPGQPFGKHGIPLKGFKIAEPYPAPYEKQTKSVLEGGSALILPGGNALLSDGVILRTYSETNTAQLVVRGAHCAYNATNHSVDSTGPIQMQTADGKFTIQGTGFYLNQTNSSMVISNNVRTVIDSALLQSNENNTIDATNGAESGPLFISSRHFYYDGPSGRGIWSDHVEVLRTNLTGTNLVLDSEVLTAEVPIKERGVRSLLAERDVSVDYLELHATGQRLDYVPENGSVIISDQATWQAQHREGRGDKLIIDRTNQVFRVKGRAWLKLPGDALGQSGLFAGSNRPPVSAGKPIKRSVDITCDNYEIRTNLALFNDQVLLQEQVDDKTRSKMNCQAMAVTFSGTNQLQTITADKDVVIESGDKKEDYKKLTGGHAFYTHTNTILKLTQNPTWRAGTREGKGDLIRLNTQENEMLVQGNAFMRLPANELAGHLLTPGTIGTTNRLTQSATARTMTNEFAEVFCEQYTLRQDVSSFRGGVYATHPEMNWSCEKLTVQATTPGLTNMVAEQNVVFELMTQKGTVHGKGDDALYSLGTFNTVTNGLLPVDQLTLKGTPAILSNTNNTVQNPVIIWDRLRDKMNFPGNEYRITGTAKLINTNIFLLPNKKRKK